MMLENIDVPIFTKHSLRESLEVANKFCDDLGVVDGLNDTYGYFLNHPVSSLNQKRLEEIMRRILEIAINKRYGIKVLDLACGGGFITSSVSRLLRDVVPKNPTVLGIDINSKEINLATSFAEYSKSEAIFYVDDIVKDKCWIHRAEKALGGSPDVVILAYALHHLPDVEKFVKHLGENLPVGTVLIVNEENPISPLFRLKHIVRGIVQNDTEGECHRKYYEWVRMLKSSGFKSDSLTGFDVFPFLNSISKKLCWSFVFSAIRN